MNITQQLIERLKEMRDQIRYYGLVLGGIFIAIDVLQYAIHNNLTVMMAFLFSIFKIATLFIAASQIIKRIKKAFFTTGMTYAQSFSLIIKLFLYASLLAGIFNFVLNRWLAPDYLSEVMHNTVESYRNYIDNAGLSSAQGNIIENFIETLEDSPTPTPVSAMWAQMWAYILWGLFIGFILSFFFRDKDVTPFDQIEELDTPNS